MVELLQRFPPAATGIAASAHMRAAAAYLSGSEELAQCRRTVASAMLAFDPDTASCPAGVFCTVRNRSPAPAHADTTGCRHGQHWPSNWQLAHACLAVHEDSLVAGLCVT